jgi:cephalosporin-C deacetylase-like acetyl esterase
MVFQRPALHCRPHPVFLAAFVALTAPFTSLAQPMAVSPDKVSGVYRVGDIVRWTVMWTGSGPPPVAHYTLKADGVKVIRNGALRFFSGRARLGTRIASPETLLLEVTWQPSAPDNRAVGGAVAEPGAIAPAAPPPADFAAFWKGKLQDLESVPVNPELQRANSGKAGVCYWKVTLDNIGGTHVRGQIARPEREGRFPAILIPQWAGVYALQKQWVTNFAAQGWLALNFEAHDIPIDREPSFYTGQFSGPLRNYWSTGNDDREKSYFLRMFLSCNQALRYLEGRPDWDGRTLVVAGASQGGMQGLMLAGLHPNEITALMVDVPAGCDMLAPTLGHAPGWPDWYHQTDGKDPEKVRQTSRYFDAANFARTIRCPVLVGLGLRDEVAFPSSVLAAVHEIRSPKEVVIMPMADHTGEKGPHKEYEKRLWGAWLPALHDGKYVPPGVSF